MRLHTRAQLGPERLSRPLPVWTRCHPMSVGHQVYIFGQVRGTGPSQCRRRQTESSAHEFARSNARLVLFCVQTLSYKRGCAQALHLLCTHSAGLGVFTATSSGWLDFVKRNKAVAKISTVLRRRKRLSQVSHGSLVPGLAAGGGSQRRSLRNGTLGDSNSNASTPASNLCTYHARPIHSFGARVRQKMRRSACPGLSRGCQVCSDT